MSKLDHVNHAAEQAILRIMKDVFPKQSQIEAMEEKDPDFDVIELAADYGDAVLRGVYNALMEYYPIDIYCEDLRNYIVRKFEECQCAGAASGGANCISSFTPENSAGVVDIHAKEEKGKMKESIKWVVKQECEGDIGYFDEWTGLVGDIESAQLYDSEAEAQNDADSGNEYLADNGYDGHTWVEKVDTSTFGLTESDVWAIPRSKRIKESKALPGGNLDSKETTDYEKTLAEHNKNRKEKNPIEGNMQEKLKGPDCGANGIHNWDGSLKESMNFDSIYEKYSKIAE